MILRFFWLLLVVSSIISYSYSQTNNPDTLIVKTFSWNDPSPEGWSTPYKGRFVFPDDDRSWERILMVRKLKCDSATKLDKYPCGEWDYITNTEVHFPAGDTIEIFELESFVTPYGKRLKMGGENGWTWIYDVTDYAPLLKGEVVLKSGNNAELLDMEFHFIEGTPVREVISIENLYPYGLYKYKDLADDSVLKPRKIHLSQEGTGFVLRARISGHGHAGPRNCCEWDSKTHTYYINSWEHFRWNVWRDCGFNPIYPQGGTWPFDRAGWCPGTKVDVYDFEITSKVKAGDTIDFDYDIEAYKENGEKDGEFRMSHQLITYGAPNFRNDVRLEEIIAPSDADHYSRINPICNGPRILIRNTGSNELKSLTIEYSLNNKKPSEFVWTGNLKFMETEEIWLNEFKTKKLKDVNMFTVELKDPNGTADEYEQNNALSTTFTAPMVLPSDFVLEIETNDLGRATENEWYITNETGEVIYFKNCLEDDSVYMEKISLPDGCYELLLTDDMEDGMNRHWWNRNSNPDLVGKNGRIEIKSNKGDILKKFDYDFGEKILFRFRVDN